MAGQFNKVTSPYIAGNPVGGSPAFVGRQSTLRDVLRTLQNPNKNAIVLFGNDASARPRCCKNWRSKSLPMAPITQSNFDLHDKAALPLERVIHDIAQRVAAQLKLPQPPDWGARAPERLRTEFLPNALAQLPADHALVLLFDEFDVLDSPKESQAGAAFFPYLRELMTVSPRLQFVFVIGRRPQDLSTLTLSVFKGVRSAHISLLDAKETEQLVRLSETNGSLRWSPEAVAAVRSLTGGHPFLIQQLCQEVWEQAHEEHARRRTFRLCTHRRSNKPWLWPCARPPMLWSGCGTGLARPSALSPRRWPVPGRSR
jgi:hypothetical protein